VTTQLRLVEPPEPRSRPAKGSARATTRRARTASARTGRRAASWGDWRLDAGTRQIGRAGVAAARQALEAAIDTDLDHGLRAS
jgi:hypothetical protein